MTHARPHREVKCLTCVWHGFRWYGADGILLEPCPECGGRVTYATRHPGDQPVMAEMEALRQRGQHSVSESEKKGVLPGCSGQLQPFGYLGDIVNQESIQ